MDINEMVEVFNDTLHSGAGQYMPLNTGAIQDRIVPWWNAQCILANRERKAALRRYQRSRLMADKSIYSQAKAKYVKRQAKHASRQKFVSTINSNTPTNKVWKRIHIMNGKYKSNPAPCLQPQERLETDQERVSNIMAEQLLYS